jgi:hypothetical protein
MAGLTLDTLLRGDRLQPAWLMYIASTPGVRLWTGPANFKLSACGQDATGGLYLGLGILCSVPSLRIPLNGNFALHTFSLSGVSKAAIQAVDADRNAIRNARISFARVELDADMNPVAAPVWVWVGEVIGLRMSRDGKGNPPTRTISLISAAGSAGRTVQTGGLWTGVQQRQIDPNDSSCDLVPYYANATDEIWPT